MNELVKYDAACRALAECSRVDEVKSIHDKAVAIKAYAKQAQNLELKADAERIIWRAKERLGELLSQMNLQAGRRTGSENTTPSLDEMGLNKHISSEAQHVADIDDGAMARALAGAHPDKEIRGLLSKVRREARHQDIHNKAVAIEGQFGPFPLIYADPPWKFDTYSEKGLERAPDKHYPTMSDEDIINLKIGDSHMDTIAAKDAACLMWCTSSNLHRAIWVLEGWGFTYKTSAVWIKTKEDGGVWTGTGLVFRNGHEMLLYGTRGNMPGPQYQPPSVWLLPRGAHSAKPPEIRKDIERMYPDFDAETRVELFCRDELDGWTTHGYES